MKTFPYCICCGEEFSETNCFTEAGWKETQISGYCERCFEAMFTEEEEAPTEQIYRYEEFAAMVEDGVINPLDGSAFYGTEETVTDLSVWHTRKPVEYNFVWYYSA